MTIPPIISLSQNPEAKKQKLSILRKGRPDPDSVFFFWLLLTLSGSAVVHGHTANRNICHVAHTNVHPLIALMHQYTHTTQGPQGKTSNQPKTKARHAVLSTAAIVNADAGNVEQTFKYLGIAVELELTPRVLWHHSSQAETTLHV